MEIEEKDLGKIVQLPVRPEWGLGIIAKIEHRFAHIQFQGTKEKGAKKYFRTGNPLVLSKDQNQPELTRRARSKNKKIRAFLPKPVQP